MVVCSRTEMNSKHMIVVVGLYEFGGGMHCQCLWFMVARLDCKLSRALALFDFRFPDGEVVSGALT